MIVLDASTIIAYLDATDAHHQRAVTVLSREVDDEFVANPLTIAEVLVGPARRGRLDQAREALKALGVVELPFPADSSLQLARLRSETGLRMPDCCVLLAAEQGLGARLATFDRRLAQAAAHRGVTVVTD
ncbi:hypothetical protein BKD30_10375 [Tersicoccus phoenicis]|uniref:Ribonuclease VapC n=1 Tax=Tersicoccus phoenicis TaxID=554083 RepID=A0A1R1L8Q3_9MICC|nr:hypothetical protein BKD30_10375 [Tersicoccus phoenicis]